MDDRVVTVSVVLRGPDPRCGHRSGVLLRASELSAPGVHNFHENYPPACHVDPLGVRRGEDRERSTV